MAKSAVKTHQELVSQGESSANYTHLIICTYFPCFFTYLWENKYNLVVKHKNPFV